jgi:hypothetical protein
MSRPAPPFHINDAVHVIHGLSPDGTLRAAGGREAVILYDSHGMGPCDADPDRHLALRTAVHVEPSWLTWSGGIVVRLAEEAHENRRMPEGVRDNDALGVLVDALEEAGGPGEMLGHLRGQEPLWKGCWCVDLLTGKG